MQFSDNQVGMHLFREKNQSSSVGFSDSYGFFPYINNNKKLICGTQNRAGLCFELSSTQFLTPTTN